MRDPITIIPTADVDLQGQLTLIPRALGVVVFVHGSDSSCLGSRNQFVATELQRSGFSTLLFDLLTPDEHTIDELTRELRFDIPRLGRRLVDTIDWLQGQARTQSLRVGLLGASTGAAAALVAAAERPFEVGAVVAHDGRPDLASAHLPRVQASTLLIVGGLDDPVISMNRQAAAALRCEHEVLIAAPGTPEAIADLARSWFVSRLG
jgi:dienelactone hydrolase